MFENSALSFDIATTKPKLRSLFPEVKYEWEYEKYINEFLSFTFLLNDKENSFRISHKSFRDFLVAKFFFKELTEKNTVESFTSFGKNLSTLEIDLFLIEMGLKKEDINTQLSGLRDLIRINPEFDIQSKLPFFISNCINLLLRLTNMQYQKHINFTQGEINLEDSKLVNIHALVHLQSNVTMLNLANNSIQDISAFKFLHSLNLVFVNLHNNKITDVSSLKGLSKIRTLDLSKNCLSTVSGLIGLENLEIFNLSFNSIIDINYLNKINKSDDEYKGEEAGKRHSDMSKRKPKNQTPKLKNINLANNLITDVGVLVNFQELRILDIRNNKVRTLGHLESLELLNELYLNNNELALKELKTINSKMPKLNLDVMILSWPKTSISVKTLFPDILKTNFRNEYFKNLKLLWNTKQNRSGYISKFIS